MKTIIQFLALYVIIFLTACSKTDDSATTPDLSLAVEQEIITGTWIVSSYTDKGKNETSDYTGYNFIFSDNGSVTATVSGLTYTGTWSMGSDHIGSDDSGHHSGDDSKLIITISGNYQMDELSDDFRIVRISDAEIVLKDDNHNKIKELIFIKK
ncbi:MAG: hypothetical protein V1775_10580 [Bacteroidota bacterium]